ncbi:hypothetical protein F190043G2_11740 [Blautia caecimuris]
MKKEILIADNIDNIYDEINALIREKKTNVKKVVAEVSKRLEQEYGSGFDKTSISRMIKFYQEFPDFEKVATLSQQLI